MITAPYNFVPLNKEVFYPDWAEKVSHDIPFEDGESGEIEISITAKSPIFVRDHADPKRFCNYNGHYYIPGSSLKGVLRTIIEIISFSKLQLQDKTLSYRDLNHPSYKKKAMDTNKIYMGWLYKKQDNWIIENIGNITRGDTRIKYKDMKKFLDSKIVDKIKKTKDAYKKYTFVQNSQGKMDRALLDIPEGTIVFTGSTGNKTREFLFPRVQPIKTYTFSKDDFLIKTFIEAYYIGTPNESKDWKNLWSNEFENGKKIPVFFQLDQNDNIQHFGLSMLYKLPYENSLQELLEQYQDFKEELDFTQTMFGYVKEKKALKGRLFFSHLLATKPQNYNKSVILPLSTPRATFYPNYIVQCSVEGKTKRYITYDDKKAILRGFKFYPHKKNIITQDEMCQKNTNICTQFTPLDTGSVFQGKIRFHNLKPQEIGALILSLTLFDNKESFHKIGMAKGYGFGSVDINITNETLQKSKDIYKEAFVKSLEEKLNISLLEHPRIKALMLLTSYSFADKELQYMPIKNFVFAKKPFNKFVLKEVVEQGYDKSKICTHNSAKQNHITKKPFKNKKPQSQSQQNAVLYSLKSIAKECNKSINQVIKIIDDSNLPIKKGLKENDSLKEAQAKGLINYIKKQK